MGEMFKVRQNNGKFKNPLCLYYTDYNNINTLTVLRRYSNFLKIEWNVPEVLIFCKDHLFQKVRQVEKDRKE